VFCTARIECPKGTLYHRFTCKEDIIAELATQAVRTRTEMIRRAAGFRGRARARVFALGEAVALFTRLHIDSSRILHTASGPLLEKATAGRLHSFALEQAQAKEILMSILQDAVREGDLVPRGEGVLEEIALGAWSLVEGAFTLYENGVLEVTFGMSAPFHRIFHCFNMMADGYGWKPFFADYDWEESLAQVRKEVFPQETEAIYGPGAWYGDRA
jgi:AcrR family transcriptional regulator